MLSHFSFKQNEHGRFVSSDHLSTLSLEVSLLGLLKFQMMKLFMDNGGGDDSAGSFFLPSDGGGSLSWIVFKITARGVLVFSSLSIREHISGSWDNIL